MNREQAMAMGKFWILDENKMPKRTPSVEEWGRFFDTNDRIVKQDSIGDVLVSTVFLGLDHQWGDGPPLLFETMVFGGDLDGYQDRCSTWMQAEAMHAIACALLRGN